MHRFDLIRDADVGAILRLAGEVSELPANKSIRRTHMLRGLLTLIGGRSAVAMEIALPHEGPHARPGTVIVLDPSCEAEARNCELFLVNDHPSDPALPGFLAARGQVVTMVRGIEDKVYKRTPHYDLLRRPFDIDHSLYCRLPLPGGDDVGIGIQRCPGDPEFTPRDLAIIHMLHTHAPHVYDVPRTAPSELSKLAPRLQPVLRYLLQGDAEKEVAAKLGLSRHTVHRYTQVIYQELGLHGRGELLAKYARWQ